jgi:hypothetical protein
MPPMRGLTYGGGKRSSMAPSALLGRLLGPVDGQLHNIQMVSAYVRRNLVHARIAVLNRAWCVCQRNVVCACPLLGEGGDEVYDAIRYGLSRLVMICQNYNGAGIEAYAARMCMAAYLPVTELYEKHGLHAIQTLRGADEKPLVGMQAACASVNIDTVLCFNTMPNMCGLVWNAHFWYEGSEYREGSLEFVFEHIFGKAFPLRCHFRNMQKICILYGVQFGEFADCMYAIVRCSLMGLYPTASSACSFEAIRQVHKLFTPAEGMDSGQRCEFVCRFGYVMFHSVKEFLCNVIRGVSGLREVLDLTYRWWTFDARVSETMTQIRHMLSDAFVSIDADSNLLETVESKSDEQEFTLGLDEANDEDKLLSGFVGGALAERTLTRWDRASKSMSTGAVVASRGPDRNRPTTFEAAMGPVEDRAYRMNNDQEKNMYHMRRDAPHTVIRLCLGANMASRVETRLPIPRYEPIFMDTMEERMHAFYGVDKELAEVIAEGLDIYCATGYIASRMLSVLQHNTLPATQAAAISRYCEDADISSMFHFVSLPDSIRRGQLQALRNKFAILPHTTNEQELSDLSEVLFCLTCMSFKAFVVESAENGVVACGFVGIPNVVHDLNTDQVLCRQCVQDSRMFRFRLVGMAVRVGRNTHIICTGCAAITILDPFAYKSDEYVCVTCVQKRMLARQNAMLQLDYCPVVSCKKKLPKETGWQHIVVQDDITSDEVRIVAFCRQHRYVASQVAKHTNILSEILNSIDGISKDAQMARRGPFNRREVGRYTSKARLRAPYSLFGGLS